MGVIRGVRPFGDPASHLDAEEDCPLSDFIESADDSRQALDISGGGPASSEGRRRQRRQRRATLIATPGGAIASTTSQSLRTGPGSGHRTSSPIRAGDIDGLSSRGLPAHRSHRKQRRLQNDKQLRALCHEDDDLLEISIYDFIEDSVSVFALILQERDNLALWNAVLTAEADDGDASDEDAFNGRGQKGDPCKKQHRGVMRNSRNRQHPTAITAEDCYRRLDSDLRRTLRRQRCPLDMIKSIEEQLEHFFTDTPSGVYRARIENSFARLMLHAVCEYTNLHSKSMDHGGHRWTFVRNPHSTFVRPPAPLSTFLEDRRRSSAKVAGRGRAPPQAQASPQCRLQQLQLIQQKQQESQSQIVLH